MLHLLIDTLRNSVLITGIVIIMMMMIESFNLESHSRFFNRVKGSSFRQVLLAALLGSIPGCIGGFATVSLYSRRLLSFGALTAMMIASAGDEAFVMLAMMPDKALWIFALLFVIAVFSGIAIDWIMKSRNIVDCHPDQSTACHHDQSTACHHDQSAACHHDQSTACHHDQSAHCHHDQSAHCHPERSEGSGSEQRKTVTDSSLPLRMTTSQIRMTTSQIRMTTPQIRMTTPQIAPTAGGKEDAMAEKDGQDTERRSLTWQRLVLTGAIALFAIALAAGWMEHDHAVSETGHIQINLLSEWWMNLIFAILCIVMVVIMCFRSDRFIKETLWHHVLQKHLPNIFAWTFGVLLAIGLLSEYIDLNTWVSDNPALMILLAVAIGIIPESGPHLIFVTLYASGLVPLPVLLASSISQDGHSSLPLLAEDKKSFAYAKLLNCLIALIVGFGTLLLF